MSIKHLTLFRRQFVIGNYLIEFGQVSDVNHRVSFEFGVVSHDHGTVRTLDHGSNRLNNEGTAIADTVFGDAADSHDRNIC